MRQFVLFDGLHHFEASDLLAVEPGDDVGKELSRLGGQLRRALLHRIPQSRGQFGRARARVETRRVPLLAFAKIGRGEILVAGQQHARQCVAGVQNMARDIAERH